MLPLSTHAYTHPHAHTFAHISGVRQVLLEREREGGRRRKGKEGEEVTAQLGGLREPRVCVCVRVSAVCVSSSDLSSLPSVNHRL